MIMFHPYFPYDSRNLVQGPFFNFIASKIHPTSMFQCLHIRVNHFPHFFGLTACHPILKQIFRLQACKTTCICSIIVTFPTRTHILLHLLVYPQTPAWQRSSYSIDTLLEYSYNSPLFTFISHYAGWWIASWLWSLVPGLEGRNITDIYQPPVKYNLA